jgi:hypothetical protein
LARLASSPSRGRHHWQGSVPASNRAHSRMWWAQQPVSGCCSGVHVTPTTPTLTARHASVGWRVSQEQHTTARPLSAAHRLWSSHKNQVSAGQAIPTVSKNRKEATVSEDPTRLGTLSCAVVCESLKLQNGHGIALCQGMFEGARSEVRRRLCHTRRISES